MLAFNHLGKLGRLGNQMFQYAALRGIAAARGYEWCIPKHNEVFVDGIGNKLRIELFDVFQLSNCGPKNIFLLDRGYAPVVEEKSFSFDQELLSLCPNDVSLFGYFQSEKWFKHIENQIRDDFTFLGEVSAPCREMISSVENPIALHIRRTDYVLNSQNHFNLGIDYYENALKLFDDNRNVIVFSDDPNWCKQQSLFSDDRFLISENTDNRIDLCLMSLCSDFIIANSTFSWWGAWLANRGDVVAPKNWFGPALEKNHNTEDLLLKHWKVI